MLQKDSAQSTSFDDRKLAWLGYEMRTARKNIVGSDRPIF